MSASSARVQIGPILSIDQASAIAPRRVTRPKVGRSPTTPQKAEGVRMLPQVSEPSAKGTQRAATAEPEPLELPPDHREGSQGFLPGPCSEAAAR